MDNHFVIVDFLANQKTPSKKTPSKKAATPKTPVKVASPVDDDEPSTSKAGLKRMLLGLEYASIDINK